MAGLPPDLLKILGPDVMALLQQMMSAASDATVTQTRSSLPPTSMPSPSRMMPPESLPWQEQMSLLRPEDIMRGEMPLNWRDAMGMMKLTKSVPQFSKLSKVGRDILDFLLQKEREYPGFGGSSFVYLKQAADKLSLPIQSDLPILADAMKAAFGEPAAKQAVEFFTREQGIASRGTQMNALEAAQGRLSKHPKLEGKDPQNLLSWKDLW